MAIEANLSLLHNDRNFITSPDMQSCGKCASRNNKGRAIL